MVRSIEEFVEHARTQTPEAFAESHPHPFLVLRLVDDQSTDEWAFKTSTITSFKIDAAQRLLEAGLVIDPAADEYHVFPVLKSPGNPWRDRISIGRARNTDIVLPHRSVSKLHAYFRVAEGNYSVLDADSRNGTMVNEKKLAKDEVITLRSGDTVVFGAASMLFLDPEKFHGFVGNMVRRSDGDV